MTAPTRRALVYWRRLKYFWPPILVKDSDMAAVLLVEDVPTVRIVLRAFLESAGHGVIECAGGEEAAGLMKRHRFEAVVTDLCMKDGDGLDFIRAQRSDGTTIPIIAMTGGDPRSPQPKAGALALRAGASLLLMKPVTKSDILKAIADTVGSSASGKDVSRTKGVTILDLFNIGRAASET